MAEKLTKIEIVRDLSLKYASRYHLKITAVRKMVQGTLDMITDALVHAKTVELRNFGVFVVVDRKSRKARNPRANCEVIIPARKIVKFKPGKVMVDQITRVSMKEPKA